MTEFAMPTVLAAATYAHGNPMFLAFLAWIALNGLFLAGVSLRYWARYGRAR